MGELPATRALGVSWGAKAERLKWGSPFPRFASIIIASRDDALLTNAPGKHRIGNLQSQTHVPP
eukprot:708787-Pyramimonas_sp.AAC.1